MKKMKVFSVLSLVFMALLFVITSCDEQGLSDMVDPNSVYNRKVAQQTVEDGETGVPIDVSLLFDVNENVDSISITGDNITLAFDSDGAKVKLSVIGMNEVDGCSVFSGKCFTTIIFVPGGFNDHCDLDPDTVYNLVLDGLSIEGGTVLDAMTISFTTGPVPAGYTPDLCSERLPPPWWTLDGDSLDPTDGLAGGIGGAYLGTTKVIGIEADSPYKGFDNPGNANILFGSWSFGESFVIPPTWQPIITWLLHSYVRYLAINSIRSFPPQYNG